MSPKPDKDKALLIAKLRNAISRLPGLSESILESDDFNLEDISSLHIFAYGSLISDPHYEPATTQKGYLWGFTRDFCCRSVRSGTQEFYGLTLGLNENEEGIVPGRILTYEDMTIEELTEMLTAYADREVTPHNIYKFEMLEIEKEDGKKIFALVCIANAKSDGFVNDSLSHRARKRLNKDERKEVTIWRKSSIIAQADGPAGTNKSYLDRYVRYDIQKKPVTYDEAAAKKLPENERKRLKAISQDQARMKQLIDAVDIQRQFMLPLETKRLEKIEKRQWDKFVERQESKPNPPSETLMQKLSRQMFGPK